MDAYAKAIGEEAIGKLAAAGAILKDDKLWEMAIRAERRLRAHARLEKVKSLGAR